MFKEYTLPLKGAALALTLILTAQFAWSAESIIDEWNGGRIPPAPELKTVSINPKTTALLLLDFNKQTCNAERRPRCIASIPKVRRLLTEARSRGLFIIYSLSPGAASTDIAKELSPFPGDPVVTSGPDKFLGTDLEKILRGKNIETVIVTGTAAHGAVLYTASGAAFRSIRTIVAVDGISAEDLYPEQYSVWHLVNAPRLSAQVTLTRTAMIRFNEVK